MDVSGDPCDSEPQVPGRPRDLNPSAGQGAGSDTAPCHTGASSRAAASARVELRGWSAVGFAVGVRVGILFTEVSVKLARPAVSVVGGSGNASLAWQADRNRRPTRGEA